MKNRVTGSYDARLMGRSAVVQVQDFDNPRKPYSGRVLDLDGQESYVQLPANLFKDHTVTWEGWVKWRNFTTYSRLFDFSDAPVQVALGTHFNSPSLLIQTWRAPEFDDHKMRVHQGILTTNTWYHLAAVISPETVKVFLNGQLISSSLEAGFYKPSPLPPLANYLGRSVMKGNRNAGADKELDGQMAEIRLWSGERSADQILNTINETLSGKEPGLLALWNFQDGTAADVTGNKKDGKLFGNARITQGDREGSTDLPATISGMVTDPTGKPMGNVTVHLLHPSQDPSSTQIEVLKDTTTTDDTGSFSFAVFASSVPYELKASLATLGARSGGHHLQSGSHLTVNLRLANAISLAGRIKSLDGSPLPNVVVQAALDTSETNTAGSSPGEMVCVATDEKGDFRFINLRPGKWNLRLNLPRVQNHLSQELAGLLVEDGRGPTNLTMEVPPFKKGRWVNYTTGNGLVGNMVRQGALGPDGALWLLGSGGLSRHDGRENRDRSSRSLQEPLRMRSPASMSTPPTWLGWGVSGESPSWTGAGKLLAEKESTI